MNTAFDHQLATIPHYQRYPAMMPFVGAHYEAPPLERILLVGESNYLPKDSTIHLDSSAWYASSQDSLSSKEVEWIENRSLVSGNWAPKAHMIYRELNTRMAEAANLNEGRAMDHVAYMNGFQRPAPTTGDSIRKYLTDEDVIVSRSVIQSVIDILQPAQVIFTSKLAWDYLGAPLSKKDDSRRFAGVCHPGTGGRYWHKAGYRDGVSKFRSIIADCRIS